MVEPDVAEEIELDFNFPPRDNRASRSGRPYRLYTATSKNPKSLDSLYSKTDLLITFGGDGTILRAVSLFAATEVPPVISFALGTLGFLVPFDIKEAEEVMQRVCSGQAKVSRRRRLKCEIYKSNVKPRKISSPSGQPILLSSPFDSTLVSQTYVMNDISIHRGPEPHLTHLDIFFSSLFFTRCISDGVVIATPTGSTAYSLSAGGSIVHPSVPCTLMTPICPRSLSFRPLVVPSKMKIEVQVSPQTRGQSTEINVDGVRKGILGVGDRVVVVEEPIGKSGIGNGIRDGIWCVTKAEGDWIKQLNGSLGFNSMFGK